MKFSKCLILLGLFFSTLGPCQSVTNEDINELNQIIESAAVSSESAKIIKSDPMIKRIYNDNGRAAEAHLSLASLEKYCALQKNNTKSVESSLNSALEIFNPQLKNASFAKIDGELRNYFEKQYSQELIGEENNYFLIIRFSSKLRSVQKKMIEDNNKIKPAVLLEQWKAERERIQRKKRGWLTSEHTFYQERCEEILAFHNVIIQRLSGTVQIDPFQKLNQSLANDCRTKTTDLLMYANYYKAQNGTDSFLSSLVSAYSQEEFDTLAQGIETTSLKEKKSSEKMVTIKEKIKEAQEKSKSFNKEHFEQDLCLPFSKDTKKMSDAIIDSGYTQGLSLGKELSDSLEQFKIVCSDRAKEADSGADQYFNSLKRLHEFQPKINQYLKNIVFTHQGLEKKCNRSIEVYKLMKRKDLENYETIKEGIIKEEQKAKQAEQDQKNEQTDKKDESLGK